MVSQKEKRVLFHAYTRLVLGFAVISAAAACVWSIYFAPAQISYQESLKTFAILTFSLTAIVAVVFGVLLLLLIKYKSSVSKRGEKKPNDCVDRS